MKVTYKIDSVFNQIADALWLPILDSGHLIGVQEGDFPEYWKSDCIKDLLRYKPLSCGDRTFSFQPMNSRVNFQRFIVTSVYPTYPDFRNAFFLGLQHANNSKMKKVIIQNPTYLDKVTCRDYFLGIYDFNKKFPDAKIEELSFVGWRDNISTCQDVQKYINDGIDRIGDEIPYKVKVLRKMSLE